MRWPTIVAAAALAACGYADQGTEPLEPLDEAVYVRDVHPIFEARCATLDCHGDPGRPLRLYAETGLRLRDELRDTPITDEELALDVEAARGVDPGVAPGRSLILRKPLAAAAGGIEHEGGDLWTTRDEPQAACVLAWLEGREDDASRAACAAAAQEVALPPEE